MNAQQTIKEMQAMYLDYFNNFLSVERFAEHYEISEPVAQQVIKAGREIHELKVAEQ